MEEHTGETPGPAGVFPGTEGEPDLAPGSGIDAAFARARGHLLSLQNEDGHWCGLLEGDSAVEAEYVLVLHFFGRAHEIRAGKLAAFIRSRQNDEGGWSLYHGGPSNVSSSVKTYFALKLLGDDADEEHMRRARETILELGGVEATNTYTRIYLALFGQYPWERCPAVPPEMLLLPRWSPIELSDMSSWSRGIFVPLSVLWAKRPLREVPDYAHIPELFVETGEGDTGPVDAIHPFWQRFFGGIDLSLKSVEDRGLTPLRKIALERAETWIRERIELSDGLAAIFPAMANAAMALRALGLHPDHPAVKSQLDALEGLEVELDDERLKLQPCKSPVWDTANSLSVLRSAGMDGRDEPVRRAVRWLLDREVTRPGDWRARNPDGPVGGWYFEYANEFYPDCDDTAEVLSSLTDLRLEDPELEERVEGARERGLGWLLSMQNRDGGWAAFDRDCNREILTQVPFADHNAMIDPSCEDITGRVLRALALDGFERDHPAVEGGVRYLRDTQLPDGSWYGRWGCNYIYGTWLALTGLAAVGEDMSDLAYQRAVRWLLSVQNRDGGWGETLDSYDDPAHKGTGPSTATQTAWALLALHAAGHDDAPAVGRGLRYLLRTQRPDGSWDDPYWTGTGFPRVFYLRYHLYDDYFPLLALAEYRGETHGVREDDLDRDEHVAAAS